MKTVRIIGGTEPQGKGLGYRFARHGYGVVLVSRAGFSGDSELTRRR